MKSYNTTMPMGSGDKNEEEDWSIDCSDDEKYNPSQERKGVWQPRAEDIIMLFDKLEKDQFIDLRWQCPGRRPPDSDKEEEEVAEAVPDKEVVEEKPKEEEKKPVAPSEFDFDEMDTTIPSVITPRRTPGNSKTPRSIKKVARMDKVLNDMKRQRDADREARRSMFARSPAGSPGRSMTGQTTPYRPTHPVTSNTSSVSTPTSNITTPVSVTPVTSHLNTPVTAVVTSSETKLTESNLTAPTVDST